MSASPDTPDVRTRILTEATRLFAARGYDGTSIQAVSEAAGITRPTLVYHFGSKERLRREVLDRLLAHWKEDLPRVMAAATSGGDRFEAILSAVISFFVDDPSRARLLLREMLDRPDDMETRFRAHLRPWTGLLTDTIRLGQEAGSTRLDLDPEAYVLQIVTAAIGTVAAGSTAATILADEPDARRQLAELVRIARCSLFNPRPAPDGGS